MSLSICYQIVTCFVTSVGQRSIDVESRTEKETSNDITAGNGREKFMIAIKFRENIFNTV